MKKTLRGLDRNADGARRSEFQALAKAPDRLAELYEILNVLGADLAFDKGLRDSLGILRRAVPCNRAGIFLANGNHYVLLEAAGFPNCCTGRLRISGERGLISASARERKPLIANCPPGVVLDGRFSRELDDVQSSLVAPLPGKRQTIGMIALCAKSRGAFREEQADFLQLITGKMASTVLSAQMLRRIYLEMETDALTGLLNARAAFRTLEKELRRAERCSGSLAVFFLDLDGFKAVNDSLGHLAGDRLLAGVAEVLRSSLRPYDFLGRVGGDEFLAILPGLPADQAHGRLEALGDAVAGNSIAVAPGRQVSATVSIGAAMFPFDAVKGEELVYLSDRRMYDRKRARPRPHRGIGRRRSGDGAPPEKNIAAVQSPPAAT